MQINGGDGCAQQGERVRVRAAFWSRWRAFCARPRFQSTPMLEVRFGGQLQRAPRSAGAMQRQLPHPRLCSTIPAGQPRKRQFLKRRSSPSIHWPARTVPFRNAHPEPGGPSGLSSAARRSQMSLDNRSRQRRGWRLAIWPTENRSQLGPRALNTLASSRPSLPLPLAFRQPLHEKS